MRIKIRIEGVTPLICNKFTDAAAMAATDGTRVAAAAGSKGTAKEQAETKLYRSSDGKREVIPQPNVFRAIIDGGQFHKAGKSKVTTQKTSLIPACVHIEEVEIPIESSSGWTTDTRAVRIPATGGRILCHRPLFENWALEFTVVLDESTMDPKLLRSIVDDAGKRIGLGDFRPACKGPYGRFVVTKWSPEKLSKAA